MNLRPAFRRRDESKVALTPHIVKLELGLLAIAHGWGLEVIEWAGEGGEKARVREEAVGIIGHGGLERTRVGSEKFRGK
jgi:hypothetical protein